MTSRRTGIVSVATLAALTLTLVVGHAVAPEWVRRLGVDVWNLSAEEADLNRAEDAGRELNAAGDRVLRQIEASERVVGELVAGRVTLTAAVAELRRVNAGRAGFASAQRDADPTGTEPAWVAQYALRRAHVALWDDPSRQADVMRRLAAEYAALVGKEWPGVG